MNVDDEVKRQLDAVVGDRFNPPNPWRARLLRWAVAAALAVAAAAVITEVLDHYLVKAQTAPPPKKPVTIRIIPAQ